MSNNDSNKERGRAKISSHVESKVAENSDVMDNSVYVSTIMPPKLETCSSFLVMYRFIVEYNDYASLGGNVPLLRCISQVMRSRLSAKNLNNATTKQVSEALLEAYAPADFYEAIIELDSLRFRGWKDKMINIDKLYLFIGEFVALSDAIKSLTISKATVMSKFLNALQNNQFAESLDTMGIKDVECDKWPEFILARAREWNAFQRGLHVYGLGARIDHRKRFDKQYNNDKKQSYRSEVKTDTVEQHPRFKSEKLKCFGCGHITNPPHKKKDCPHKQISGWGTQQVLQTPLSLPLISDGKVAIVQSLVNGIEARVGLDTMSSLTLISSTFVDKLNGIVILSEEPVDVKGLGNVSWSVKDFVEVTIDGLSDKSFNLKCGIINLPVDLLIGWNDLKKHHLLNNIISDELMVPELKEVAPEEEEEDEDISNVPVDNSMEEWKRLFPGVCSGILPKLPAKIKQMRIVLNPDAVLPMSLPPRKFSDVVNKFIGEEINKWIDDGIIVPSTASYASQVVVAKSKGRNWRLCIDYRGLNTCTKSNVFPLPNVKSILRRVAGREWYAKVDLKKGYLQAPLDENSKELTTFICEMGTFKFNRVPFGLKNAPAFYQFAISREVLKGLLYSICEVYIDDIIIYADSEGQLKDRFRMVLERLQSHNIVINPDKCCYGVKEIEFLGHVISKQGIQLSRKKIQGLVEIETPKSKSALKSFLGLTNYFRDFIPFYAEKVALMEDLLLKKVTFKWDTAHDEAFCRIKDNIVNAGMLHMLDYSLPIIIRTDASMHGVGAVMFQYNNEKVQNVAFLSKKFTGAATRWSTIEQEAYGIFFALKQWEHLLQGHRFIVETDHKNLQYIQNATEGKVGRWRLFLQNLDYSVRHIPGKDNVIADSLSRCFVGLRVDEDRKKDIEEVHSSLSGHCGISQTIKRLKQNGKVWPKMRTDVVNYVKSCPTCQKSRVTSKEVYQSDYHVIEAYSPFEEISMDYSIDIPPDKYDNKYIFVVIDNFTKYVELFPVKSMDAITTANCLVQIFARYGAIKRIRSDRGSQFLGDVCKQLCQLTGTEQILTIGFRPQSNGVVERVNAEVSKHLKVLVAEKNMLNNWSNAIPLVQRIINSNVHTSTGFSPNSLLFGNYVDLNRGVLKNENMKVNLIKCPEYLQNLCKAQDKLLQVAQDNLASVLDKRVSKKRNNKGVDLKSFQVGDLVITVRRQGSKLDFKWKGPYKVLKKSFANTYECEDLRTKKKTQFDVSTLRSFVCPEGVDPLTIASKDEDEFKVNAIVDHRLEGTNKKNKTHYYFLVRFEDGDEDWLPYMEVRDLEAFERYLRDHLDLVRQLKLKVSA